MEPWHLFETFQQFLCLSHEKIKGRFSSTTCNPAAPLSLLFSIRIFSIQIKVFVAFFSPFDLSFQFRCSFLVFSMKCPKNTAFEVDKGMSVKNACGTGTE